MFFSKKKDENEDFINLLKKAEADMKSFKGLDLSENNVSKLYDYCLTDFNGNPITSSSNLAHKIALTDNPNSIRYFNGPKVLCDSFKDSVDFLFGQLDVSHKQHDKISFNTLLFKYNPTSTLTPWTKKPDKLIDFVYLGLLSGFIQKMQIGKSKHMDTTLFLDLDKDNKYFKEPQLSQEMIRWMQTKGFKIPSYITHDER